MVLVIHILIANNKTLNDDDIPWPSSIKKYNIELNPISSNVNIDDSLYQKYLTRINTYISHRQTRHKEAPVIIR